MSKGDNNRSTLCWSCSNAYAHLCIWHASKGRIPVQGWDAEQTVLYSDTEREHPSYRVIGCPNYKQEEPRGWRMDETAACACGCGTIIQKFDINGHVRKYVDRRHVDAARRRRIKEAVGK